MMRDNTKLCVLTLGVLIIIAVEGAELIWRSTLTPVERQCARWASVDQGCVAAAGMTPEEQMAAQRATGVIIDPGQHH